MTKNIYVHQLMDYRSIFVHIRVKYMRDIYAPFSKMHLFAYMKVV